MNFLKHLILGALLLTTGKVVAQVTTGGNVAGASTDFLGWNTNAANNFPLMVRHDLNRPIHFFTDNRFRMLVNPSVTYGLLGGFSLIPADGFALITPNDLFLQSGPKGPFSRLHLAEGNGDNTQELGYRPWQRNGITFTGNGDHGYIGHKYKDEDYTDMIIQWSDNPGENRPDRMRFLFTSEYNGAGTGAQSDEGLEGMRLWPVDFREIHVGVGDFYADGTDPTERSMCSMAACGSKNCPTTSLPKG